VTAPEEKAGIKIDAMLEELDAVSKMPMLPIFMQPVVRNAVHDYS